ncbi:hypothetical protein BH10CHL1_BH10CHL1_04980 [soil metagenome]
MYEEASASPFMHALSPFTPAIAAIGGLQLIRAYRSDAINFASKVVPSLLLPTVSQ